MRAFYWMEMPALSVTLWACGVIYHAAWVKINICTSILCCKFFLVSLSHSKFQKIQHFSSSSFPAKRCPPLNSSHGSFLCSHPHEEFSFGSRCNLTCEEGFVLNGTVDTECTSQGSWSLEIPHCSGKRIIDACIIIMQQSGLIVPIPVYLLKLQIIMLVYPSTYFTSSKEMFHSELPSSRILQLLWSLRSVQFWLSVYINLYGGFCPERDSWHRVLLSGHLER